MDALHIGFAAALGVLGLAAGRFLHAAAAGLLEKRPILALWITCGHCGKRLQPLQWVPLFAARCRRCERRRSGGVYAAEAAAALTFALSGLVFGPLNGEWLAGLLLAAVLIVITQTDLKAMVIPNKAVAAGVAAAVLVRLFVHPLPLWNYAAAAALGFFALYAAAFLSRGGIGGGDIKLYLFIGLICGIGGTALSLFASSAIGAAYGLAARLGGRLKKGEEIPFGPFIAAGSLFAYYWHHFPYM